MQGGGGLERDQDLSSSSLLLQASGQVVSVVGVMQALPLRKDDTSVCQGLLS